MEILKIISELKQRERDEQKIKGIIKKLCSVRALNSDEIAAIFNKREDYIRRKYLRQMIDSRELRYLYPEMISHPEQAYITNIKDESDG
jgi:ATP-dependent DNA helicase RecG